MIETSGRDAGRQRLHGAPQDQSARRASTGHPRSPRAKTGRPRRTEECSIAGTLTAKSRGCFSLAVSMKGVSASALLSVPLGGEEPRRARRSPASSATRSRASSTRRRALRPFGMDRGTVAGVPPAPLQRLPRGLPPQRRRGVPIEISPLRHGGCLEIQFHSFPRKWLALVPNLAGTSILTTASSRNACFLTLALC